MDKPLQDKLALVTGASRGIGAATAVALAAAGAHVVLTARTAKDLEAVEETIFQAGGSATIAPLDLAQSDAIARLATAIGERWQALDVLVLNAGTLGSLAAVPAIQPKEFAEVLTLNVSAQAAMIAAFDAMLRRSKGARVIGVTSSVARKPRAYWGAYGASKAAFVDPGATRTNMRARAYPGEDPQSVKAPEIVAERIAALAAEGFPPGHFERVG
jgi:NAD(P)-dependent dehydrogenase (short-subunit alcohol dehydrogenase family)